MKRTAKISIVFLTGLMLLAGSAFGLPRLDEDGDQQPPACSPDTSISVHLYEKDLPLVGTDMMIRAAPATIIREQPNAGNCEYTFSQITGWTWEIASKPPGSNATLTGTSTLTPSLTLDVAGRYSIRFTACPGGCTVAVPGGNSISVPSTTRKMDVEAISEIVIPPEREPWVPSKPYASPAPSAGEKCPVIGASMWNPSWVTVGVWAGHDDYETLEGKVRASKVSRKDFPLNHDEFDVNIHVVPDPEYWGLKTVHKRDIEIEWEWPQIPEPFRPTRNDRLSAHGYWIYDCAHGDRTEIHPPVMVASHRPRPVKLADSLGLGSDVWVPGIVTHLWINAEGGKTTADCPDTGLHQPYSQSPLPLETLCVPPRIPYTSATNPIRKRFEFTIHLPRDPKEILAPYKDVPSPPLHLEILDPLNSRGPTPTITQDPQNPSILHVSVELAGYSDHDYSRKIFAAWALPSPDNWGLSEWRIAVNKLHVHNDADGPLSGDGDWRFWVNVNNTDQEWTKIFECEDCVHGEENFNNTPFQTGRPPAHSMGPDILVFPGQSLWLRTSGYEHDYGWSSDTGNVLLELPQEAATGEEDSTCKEDSASGCASYTLYYEVSQVTANVLPQLSQAGQDLYDEYIMKADEIGEDFEAMNKNQDWGLPQDVVVEAGAPPEVRHLEDFDGLQGPEPNNLFEMSEEDLAETIATASEESPEDLDRFLNALRENVDEALASPKADEVRINLAELKASFPESTWDQYFGDLDLPEL